MLTFIVRETVQLWKCQVFFKDSVVHSSPDDHWRQENDLNEFSESQQAGAQKQAHLSSQQTYDKRKKNQT